MELFIDFSFLVAVLNVCQSLNVTLLTIEIPTFRRTLEILANNFSIPSNVQRFLFIFSSALKAWKMFIFLSVQNQWNRCAINMVRSEHKCRSKLYKHCWIVCNNKRKWCIFTQNELLGISKWIHWKKWDAFLFVAHETLTAKIGYSEKKHIYTRDIVSGAVCETNRNDSAKEWENIWNVI